MSAARLPGPDEHFATTLPVGFARAAARDMVRHQITRWPMLGGYALVLALIGLGAGTRVWPAFGLGLVLAVVAAVVPVRRADATAKALRRAGLVDGRKLAADYGPTAMTVRGEDRTGTIAYDQVWAVHRHTRVVDLELRDENVRHVLPADLVPPGVEARFTVAAERTRPRVRARS